MSDSGTTANGEPRRGEELPERIGPFRILGVLGRGGMGTVYLAEQQEPVARRVALKVLNREKETDRGIARFEAERQALARMNHPSIATVFDAGTTGEGLPYFAMEVVSGRPLMAYCAEQRLPIRNRVELFLEVCDAVQHAHHKMVIHRDLKPSNVLVAVEDGRPVPKIIDFGIAKGADQPLVERAALETREGVPIGTPMYMSPEQIEGKRVDLDGRADVYSLGMLLYELVAGVLPFDTTNAEPLQLMLRILKEDPLPPGARFASLPEAERARIAAERSAEPGELERAIRGDLSWITLKALERDRKRRYASAAAMRDELLRYLRTEPVLASPHTLRYRLSKFVRRHTVGFAAATAVLVALLAGLTMAVVSRQRAIAARDEAVASERKASATVDYLRKVLGSVDPGVDGRQVRVVDLLTKASEMIASDLEDEPEVEASVRATIGQTLLELGVFQDAAPELDRAVAIQEERLGADDPETLHTVNARGRLAYKLGHYEEAVAIHRSVLERLRKLLGPDDPQTLWTMYNLAKALDKLGEWQEAETLYRQNVAVRSRVLGPTNLDTLVSINSMCLFLSEIGKPEEAEELERANIANLVTVAGPEHPDTLRGRANLVEILNREQRYTEAEEAASKILQTMSRVLGPEHPETLGVTAQLAHALRRLGHCENAEPLQQRVLALRRSALGPAHPDTLDTRADLALCLDELGKRREAEELLASSVALAEQALPGGSWRSARLEAAYGHFLLAHGRHDEAEHRLLVAHRALPSLRPGDRESLLGDLVSLYEAAGRPEQASRFRGELEAVRASR